MKSLLRSILELHFPWSIKWILFRGISKYSLRDLLAKRSFEPELKIVEKLTLDTDKIALDVGANIGEYCSVLERKIPAKQIHAFEPNTETSKRLRSFFPHIHIHEIALSDHSGTAQFKVPSHNDKLFATRGSLEKRVLDSEGESFDVKISTLDAFMKERTDSICFLKVDVEGHESTLLKGATQTIERDHPIMLIEIEQRHLDLPIEIVFSQITDMGYEGYFLDLRAWAFVSIAEFKTETHQNTDTVKSTDYINNFLFMPREDAHSVIQNLTTEVLGSNPN